MHPDTLYNELLNWLYGRANVMIRKTNYDQMIVIYDDHRWLLNVLFGLSKFGEHYDLIYFDAHDDAAQCEKKSALLALIGADEVLSATEKQFGAFVEYDQRIDDGGWLTTAMELNLIGDVVNIGNRNNDNLRQMKGLYTSEEGIEHYVFEMSDNLEYELGCRGQLGDTCREDECRKLRDFFGIEHFLDRHNTPIPEKPFILDFDLDFFTMSSEDEPTHGWTEKVFNRHFPHNSRPKQFINGLIKNAQIITICREPDCCGSLGNSNRILELLDTYFFEGCIGTDTTL